MLILLLHYGCEHGVRASIIHCCFYYYLFHKQKVTFVRLLFNWMHSLKGSVNLSQNKETRKQGKVNANSETVTTLIPSGYVPAVGIWNGKLYLSPIKKNFLGGCHLSGATVHQNWRTKYTAWIALAFSQVLCINCILVHDP